jgi:hypothetical protein
MKARVKPNNNYGGYGPGTVVSHDDKLVQMTEEEFAAEIRRVPWCLEELETALASDELERQAAPSKVTVGDHEALLTAYEQLKRDHAALWATHEELKRDRYPTATSSPLTQDPPPRQQPAMDLEPASVPSKPVEDAQDQPKKGRSK